MKRIKYLGYLSAVIGLLSPLAAWGSKEKPELRFHISTYSYNDVAPVKQFFDDLQGPEIDPGELAFTTGIVELGYQTFIKSLNGLVQYSVFNRLDYYLEFSPDTVGVIYAEKNDVALDPDANYQVSLEANNTAAYGLKISYRGQQFKNLSYGISASYLHVYGTAKGKLNGEVNTVDEELQGALFLDYQYSKDVFFKRDNSGLTAPGFTLDLSVGWQITRSVSASLEARDVWSRIYWERQDRTVARASTDRFRIDNNGEFLTDALLTWQETTKSFQQSLPEQVHFAAVYNLAPSQHLGVSHVVYGDAHFNRITYSHEFAENAEFYGYYDMIARALSLGYRASTWDVSIVSDDYEISKAKTFGLGLNFYLPL